MTDPKAKLNDALDALKILLPPPPKPEETKEAPKPQTTQEPKKAGA